MRHLSIRSRPADELYAKRSSQGKTVMSLQEGYYWRSHAQITLSINELTLLRQILDELLAGRRKEASIGQFLKVWHGEKDLMLLKIRQSGYPEMKLSRKQVLRLRGWIKYRIGDFERELLEEKK